MMNVPKNNRDDKQSALESIEHELYDPKVKISSSEIHQSTNHRALNLPSSWGGDAPVIVKGKEEAALSFGTKLLLISTLLLFVVVAFSAWRIISLRNVVSAANIDMTADITPYIEGGEATPLTLTLHNRNTAVLQSASVTLLYKQGNGSQDEQEKIQEKRELGTVGADEYKKQDFSVSLYGSESETRSIVLKLEYRVAGSNAVFTKIATAQVILRTPPISVTIQGPAILSIGQSGTYTFTVKNNSATASLPSVLQVQLPNSFTVDTTVPKPIARSTSWIIGTLPVGGSQTVAIAGLFNGKQDEAGTLSAKIGSRGDNPSTIGIVYASQVIDVRLRSSPLSLGVSLATDYGSGGAIRYGDKAALTFNYTNGSSQVLEDVKIKLAISGDAPVYNSIDPVDGYYDSIQKTIVWDKASIPDLAVLAPNSQGALRVVIPVVSKGNNSPTLKVILTGSASNKEGEDIIVTLAKTYAVQGSAVLIASTQYKASSFPNSGPIPPRPNQETTYTVNLKVSAQNALGPTKVSFVLPAYVSWRGTTTDNNNITYESRTRTVTWNITHLDKGMSVGVDIGLSAKPSQSHVGQSPPITSGIVLDAEEDVSKAHLRTTLSPLTTSVKGEVWPENPALVVE